MRIEELKKREINQNKHKNRNGGKNKTKSEERIKGDDRNLPPIDSNGMEFGSLDVPSAGRICLNVFNRFILRRINYSFELKIIEISINFRTFKMGNGKACKHIS